MRAFVVVTLTAKDTILGVLTQAPGVRAELVARPPEDPLRGAYAFTLRATGMTACEASVARERLEQAAVELASSRFAEGTWRATGWIPVQSLSLRAFRLLAHLGQTGPAWVVFRGGSAQVRLRPASNPAVFLHDLLRFLHAERLAADVRLAELDAQAYADGIQALADVPEKAPLAVVGAP